MKDRYFLIGLILTFTLVSLAAFLVKGALTGFWLYSVLILICGFYFSWSARDSRNQLIRYFITAGALAISIWMIHSILGSALLYKDIIIICIKGVILLELILSFSVYLPGHLGYMQALSVPLFMCFPLVMKDYNELSVIAVLGYFICWLTTLKLKFYESFKKPVNEITFRGNNPIILLAIIFVICLSISSVFFLKYPIQQIIKGGFFLAQDLDTQASGDTLEKEYYDLQDRLQQKITELIPEFSSTQDMHSVLGLLSYLVKNPSVVMEVKKAVEGLISRLKTPGLGLEEREGQEAIIILRKFIDKKIALNLRMITENIRNTLKKAPFHIKERIAIARLVDKIQHSESISEVAQNAKQLQEVIDNSSLEADIQKELQGLARQIKEWKVFGLQHHKMYYGAESLQAQPPQAQPPQAQPPPEQPAPLPKKELTEKYLNMQRPSPDFKPAPTIDSLMRIIVKTMLLLFLCIPALFFILYLLTKNQKDKLLSLYKDPKEFIINLYANLKEILTIFGPGCNEVMPPLSYAELVQKSYVIENNLFLRFTAKFEEAKYSRHVLGLKDARAALGDYNDFLKILFSSYNKFALILRYCLTLLHRRPLSIYKPLYQSEGQ